MDSFIYELLVIIRCTQRHPIARDSWKTLVPSLEDSKGHRISANLRVYVSFNDPHRVCILIQRDCFCVRHRLRYQRRCDYLIDTLHANDCCKCQSLA